MIVHPLKYAGENVDAKLATIRKAVGTSKPKGVACVANMLDEVAWLFNLRGQDIPYNPVFFGYAIVTKTDATLFVDSSKLSDEVYASLGKSVQVKPYEEIIKACQGLAKGLQKGEKVLLGKTASLAIAEAVGKDNYAIVPSPIDQAKSIKNEVEQEGFRQCHIVRRYPISRFHRYLLTHPPKYSVMAQRCAHTSRGWKSSFCRAPRSRNQKAQTSWKSTDREQETPFPARTSIDADLRFYRKQEHFRGLSFTTISSTGPNAAIIHYSPDAEDCATIDPNQGRSHPQS